MAPVNKLLPPNASTLEHNLTDTIEVHSAVDVSRISALWNADTCPAYLLPWLAWAEKVDEWSSDWTEEVQREVIKAQRLVRRKRGTKAAVVSAVEALGGTTSIKEWFEHTPKKTPHTFDIVIVGGEDYIETGFQDSMLRAVDRSKPKRSHYTLGVSYSAAGQLNLVGVAMVVNYKRMEFTD